MKKRGVFRTTITRQQQVELSTEAKQEIDVNLEAIKPYMRHEATC